MKPLPMLCACLCLALAHVHAAPPVIPVPPAPVYTLPADTAATPAFGIVDLSVATLCTAPDFSSEPATQALLGMPVKILERRNWYLIQLPDDYTAWVHPSAVWPVEREALEAWNAEEKVVVTAQYGTVRSLPKADSRPVSDVVAGDRLKFEGTVKGYYRVGYPDGRTGYLLKSLGQTEKRWRQTLRQDVPSILATAYTLVGVPYIWAGTSSKGMDCSGFIRNILYQHDILIPRDASRQALKGERIAIAPDFSDLQPGDLLFFGSPAEGDTPERVVHVGMYMGEGRFIHSQGDVHVSGLDAADPLFDAFNLGRLLFASRVLPYINQEEGLTTTATNPYYQSPLPDGLLYPKAQE
ncbi:MAG: NlpC/P60 family protein [Prevotellaceae bacterium]|nr:NlpC/P60 family protein [Prevotellaceae bacterium]